MQRRSRRRGASLLEAALTLPVFLVLVLGTLDLGLAVFRQHTITAAARSGARMAIVHGGVVPRLNDSWGPTTIDAAISNDKVPIAKALKKLKLLSASDENETRVRVEWPEGGNSPGQRVTVTVTSPYHPVMTFIFGNPNFTLRSTSTMTIAH